MQRREVTAVREYLSLPPAAPRRRWRPRRGLRLLTLLAALGVATLAEAQPPYRQEVLAGLGGLDVGDRASPAFADLDGDGDYDCVAGNHVYMPPLGPSTAQLTYFANTGGSGAPAFVGVATSASPVAAITASQQTSPGLADLDGDGDFDLALGSSLSQLSYYPNTGDSATAAFVMAAPSATPWLFASSGFNRPSFADLDGDGDLDAAIGEKAGTLIFLRNTGNAMAPALVRVTGTANPFNGINLGSHSAPTFGDLDGDGDGDLILGTADRALHYLRNTGSSSAPAFTHVTGTASPFNGLTVGTAPRALDLDGDGDLDVVVGDFGGEFRYLLNTGSTSAPAFLVATGTANLFSGFEHGYRSKPAIADLDSDGQLDVVVGSNDGRLSYLTNTGTARNPVFEQVTGTANPFDGIDVGYGSAPTLADLDGDGDLDAVIGDSGGNASTFFNVGSSSAPVFMDAGTADPFAGFGPASASDTIPTLTDFDGDGDLDAILGVDYGVYGIGYLVTLFNTGTTAVPAFVEATGTANPFSIMTFGATATVALADLDGDGDLDVVGGESYGSMAFFVNTGSSSAPAFMRLSGSANPLDGLDLGRNTSPVIADLDGDGDFDVLVGESGGALTFLRSLAPIFVDGFESGDTSAWSATVP